MEFKMKNTFLKHSIMIFIILNLFVIKGYGDNPEWVEFNTNNSELPGEWVTDIFIDKNDLKLILNFLVYLFISILVLGAPFIFFRKTSKMLS